MKIACKKAWMPLRLLAFLASLLFVYINGIAGERYISLASTTSTDNSGLLDELLPKFASQTGINVRVTAVGTGQAIKLARNGDADVLLVHHKESEQKFVSEGFGVKRYDVMYNDFIIVGPQSDPAGVRGINDVSEALKRIADSKNIFASRGDDSGTHKKELKLWQLAGVDLESANGGWYRETGSGMGATLNVASGLNAYALTDRATWLKFMNKGKLIILSQGDQRLFNQYGVVLVNNQKHPHIKANAGQQFIDWLLSEQGQQIINAYTIEGQQAFFANAGR